MTSPYCSAFRLPRSTFSWLLRPLAQEALDAAEDRPGVASLPFLARQQRLLFGQHDEQSLGERRRHPGGPHQRVVAPAHAEVADAELRHERAVELTRQQGAPRLEVVHAGAV